MTKYRKTDLNEFMEMLESLIEEAKQSNVAWARRRNLEDARLAVRALDSARTQKP